MESLYLKESKTKNIILNKPIKKLVFNQNKKKFFLGFNRRSANIARIEEESRVENLSFKESSHLLNQEQISKCIKPLYEDQNQLLKKVEFYIKDFKEKKTYFKVKASCQFPVDSSFPELKLDHITGNIMFIVFNQIGKIIFINFLRSLSINLIDQTAKMKKRTSLKDIHIIANCQHFSKNRVDWIIKELDFFQGSDSKPFSKFSGRYCGLKN